MCNSETCSSAYLLCALFFYPRKCKLDFRQQVAFNSTARKTKVLHILLLVSLFTMRFQVVLAVASLFATVSCQLFFEGNVPTWKARVDRSREVFLKKDSGRIFFCRKLQVMPSKPPVRN